MANKDRVLILVHALLSGDYEQGPARLHNVTEKKWCCLGVAAREAIKHGLVIESHMEEDMCHRWQIESFDGNNAYLGLKVIEWYGFDNYDPYLSLLGMTASSANDKQVPFERIAMAFYQEYCKERVAE